MKKTLAFFLLFISFSVFSQNADYIKEMENNDLQIRQKPNTEGLLSEFLSSVDIKEDTIYAILYSPAECYRCETTIPAFYELLKQNNPNNKMLLITAFDDSIAARGYNENNNYKADYYLYDTKSDYEKIFSFNTGSMYGLHVMKLYPKRGIFITGGEYTFLGKEFIRQLVADDNRLEPHLFPVDAKEQSTDKAIKPAKVFSTAHPWRTKEIPIELKNGTFISRIYDIPKIENGHLFFNDMLNNGIMFFSLKDKKFTYQTLFQAEEKEKNKFIYTTKANLDRLVQQGSVYYISLSANMIDDHRLGISYSLPKILVDSTHGAYNFCLYNAPAILIRNVNNLHAEKMIPLDFDLEHSKYFHMHFNFDIFNNKVWLGCEKLTWPMDGYTKEDIADSIELDPFNDKFYHTFNPIVASFDFHNGTCNGHYGKLEDAQRKSKTGYYYSENVYAHHGKDFLYGNGYMGKLYVSDSLNIGKNSNEYTVFKIKTSSFPKPDTTKFYQQEYGTLYASDFSRCIRAVKMNDTEICCLVKYGMPRNFDLQADRYTFVVINRKSKKIQEYPLPRCSSQEKFLGYGIRNEQNTFNPFILIQDENGYKVRNLIINN